MDAAALNEIVEAVVRDRFPGAIIESVHVEHDTDSDGFPLLRVTVVFNPKSGELDVHRLTGLTRHVRHGLMAKEIDQFPVFRFMSKADAASLKIAAA